jgi:hypothetical protein
MLFVAVAALAGCAPSSAAPVVSSNGGSCAVVIELGRISYLAGRQSSIPLPLTTERFYARRAKCVDAGDGPRGTLIASKIRGIAVGDAVAADGYQLMLAERLWRVAWGDLPEPLRPYVRH